MRESHGGIESYKKNDSVVAAFKKAGPFLDSTDNIHANEKDATRVVYGGINAEAQHALLPT